MDPVDTEARPIARTGPGRLRTVVVITATAVVVAVATLLVDQSASGSAAQPGVPGGASAAVPVAGEPPPDLQATAIDGQTVSLASLRGSPVWLTFGASWCGDCRAEASDLQATYQAFHDRGLVVVGVFIDEDATAVSDYARRVGFTFAMIADPSGQIADRFHTLGIPTHYFIGRDGTIREVRLGGLQPAEMERLVAALLE